MRMNYEECKNYFMLIHNVINSQKVTKLLLQKSICIYYMQLCKVIQKRCLHMPTHYCRN